ncbi:hypothetical protein SAMN05660284_01886 [Formivibrio citricus]|uniref:Uncharacterized protein n=2 Tax=Formivibrio citricus TaxID=83765 RepID=A0A1I5AF92_9NEIS|nr:hypothetical protein SAMN05660284_01886 [Formivibrio citricus]
MTAIFAANHGPILGWCCSVQGSKETKFMNINELALLFEMAKTVFAVFAWAIICRGLARLTPAGRAKTVFVPGESRKGGL